MSTSLKSDWQSFLAAYGDYFKKRIVWLAVFFEKGKKVVASLLYRQRGRFAQPFAHFWLGLFIFLGIALSPVIEEKIRGEAMNWEEAPAGNMVGAYTSDSDYYDVSTFVSDTRGSQVDYVVGNGETLSSIAKKFGVTVDTIIWANKLPSGKTTIKAGQKLKIPPVTGIIHQVGRGETVYSIAKRYGVDPQEIVDFPFNSFSNDETFALAIGQTLVVPNGVMPEEKPVAPRFVADISQGIGAAGFIWPTSGKVTQNYFWYHPATDIANPSSPPVTAAASGTVVTVIYSRLGYGNHVIIDHGNGYKTLYGHMNKIYVEQGQGISQGQQIGQMGSTGRSTGTHLHFEVIKDGVKLDPLKLLK